MGTVDPERIRAALLGLACGDALGTTVEFRPRGSFPEMTDIIGGGPFGLQPGEWTDDTAMALCLAESLLECDGFDPLDQMNRYVRWWREGHNASNGRCFDIGATTAAALHRFLVTGDPYSGSSDDGSSGNGSLMRVAPIALFFADDPELAVARAADSSRTTHGAPAAVDACRYMVALLWGALHGVGVHELLAGRYEPVEGFWEREPLCDAIEAVATGSFRKQRERIRGSGYVVESLEAGLWALSRSISFEAGALAAVNLGDDADTTGAVYGQLAGAVFGVGGIHGIPERWIAHRLARVDLLLGIADRLASRFVG